MGRAAKRALGKAVLADEGREPEIRPLPESGGRSVIPSRRQKPAPLGPPLGRLFPGGVLVGDSQVSPRRPHSPDPRASLSFQPHTPTPPPPPGSQGTWPGLADIAGLLLSDRNKRRRAGRHPLRTPRVLGVCHLVSFAPCPPGNVAASKPYLYGWTEAQRWPAEASRSLAFPSCPTGGSQAGVRRRARGLGVRGVTGRELGCLPPACLSSLEEKASCRAVVLGGRQSR